MNRTPWLFGLGALLALSACAGGPPEADHDHAGHASDHADHAHGPPATPEAADHPATPPGPPATSEVADHAGHAHGPPASPAAELPVAELLRHTCEHGVRTFTCDECRYEVGVVRAPAALFRDGLFRLAPVARRPVAEALTLTGEVRFDERRVGHVGTQVEGIIRQVHVVLGDRVLAGQPLLELESVAIGEAQSAHLEARALLELTRRNFERVAALHRERIASDREFFQARQEQEAAQIRAEGALGRLTRLGTDGPRARLVLRAPLAGTVLQLHAVSGEVARTAESLVTVGDHRAVWVWADLYERELAAVVRAQAAGPLAAAIRVQAYPGEEFPGTVDLVSPAMDERSRTVKVRVAVDNADGRLLAGMFAAVQLCLPGADAALTVPRDAVLQDEGRAFVFVPLHDDYYLRRFVEVGRSWAGQVEVRQGLTPADSVVADGAFLMKSDVLRAKMGAGCAD